MIHEPSQRTRTRGLVTLAAGALILLWGCTDDAPPPPAAPPASGPATSVEPLAGDQQVAFAGQPVAIAPSVRVGDANGVAVAGATVVFTVSTGNGSVTGSNATTDVNGTAIVGSWTLGDPGLNRLEAAVQGVRDPAGFDAAAIGAPAQVLIIDGDDQTGAIGSPLPENPRVRVLDEFGEDIPNADVTFTPRTGSGTVGSTTVTTDFNGEAETTWSPGGVGSNLLDVSIAGVTSTVFAVGSNSPYTIQIRFVTGFSVTQKAAFGDAAGRWMSVVVGDLENVNLGIGASPNFCGENEPAITGDIDDLLVLAVIGDIDGVGGAPAVASPCIVRAVSANPGLTLVGVLKIDRADINDIQVDGLLDRLVLHTMGHVVGFGTLWRVAPNALLVNPSIPLNPGADTYFSGGNALTAFQGLPGGPWNPPGTATTPVPVENTALRARADIHWRESTFVTELMTPEITGATAELSTVTIGSFQDLGYTVDYNAADNYTLGNPNALRAAPPASASIHLGDDLLRIPIKMVDRNGTVVRVVEPSP